MLVNAREELMNTMKSLRSDQDILMEETFGLDSVLESSATTSSYSSRFIELGRFLVADDVQSTTDYEECCSYQEEFKEPIIAGCSFALYTAHLQCD